MSIKLIGRFEELLQQRQVAMKRSQDSYTEGLLLLFDIDVAIRDFLRCFLFTAKPKVLSRRRLVLHRGERMLGA